MPKPTLRDQINDVLHDHLASVLALLLLMAGTAVGYYWTTQVNLIGEASANTERSERNEAVTVEVRGYLQNINGAIIEIVKDVAVTREKVESLEKR